MDWLGACIVPMYKGKDEIMNVLIYSRGVS